MITNAQAALQAAASMYQGEEVSLNTVQGVAAHFKRWLDRQDSEDAEAQAALVVSPVQVLQQAPQYSPPRPAPPQGVPTHSLNAY